MTGDDVLALQTAAAGAGLQHRPDRTGCSARRRIAASGSSSATAALSDDGVFGPETYQGPGPDGPDGDRRPAGSCASSRSPAGAGPGCAASASSSTRRTGPTTPAGPSAACVPATSCYDIARRLEGRMAATGMETFLTRGAHGNPTRPRNGPRSPTTVNADLLLSACTSTAATSPLAEGIATFHFGTDSGSSSTLGETLAGLIQRELVARTRLRRLPGAPQARGTSCG